MHKSSTLGVTIGTIPAAQRLIEDDWKLIVIGNSDDRPQSEMHVTHFT